MRTFILICFLFSFVPTNNHAQQLYPIKETYDQFLEPHYASIADYNNDASKWWQSWGWTLLSYLRIYETTGDKAYLNKFIKHSLVTTIININNWLNK